MMRSPSTATHRTFSITFLAITFPAITFPAITFPARIAFPTRITFLALLTLAVGVCPIHAGPAPPEADLTLIVTADDSAAIAGERLVYTFSVTNAGPDTAPSTDIAITLPAEVTALSTSGCVGDPNGLPICKLQTVGVDETKIATVEVLVDAGASGSLVLKASVASSRTDPNPSDNEVKLRTAISAESVIAEGSSPTIAADPAGSGNFVIAWQAPPDAARQLDETGPWHERGQWHETAGTTGGIVAQVFGADGGAQGALIRLDQSGTSPSRPDVTRRANGEFVAVWQSEDGEQNGIFGRRFSAIGTPIGVELRLNSLETGEQSLPAVSSLGDGRFIATWSDEESLESFVRAARLFSSIGTPIGVEMRFGASDITAKPPALAVSSSGILVSWEDAAGRIAAQLFDLTGTPIGVEFHVASTGVQTRPAAAAHADGGFVVVWQTVDGGDLDGSGILGQRLSAIGTPIGVEFVVNQTTGGDQQQPAIAASPDGRFVVTWQSPDEDGRGIVSRWLDQVGVPLGVELRVSQSGAGDQTSGEPAFIDQDGTFYVAWQSDDGQSDIVIAPSNLLFGDGFESGDLTGWHAHTPQ